MLKKTLVMAGAVAMMSLATPAHADITSGNGSILGGNQVHVPIVAPINVCGNAIPVIGVAVAGCRGGAGAYAPSNH
ncbi:chaplin family protein [Nonomuraea zeae]|uniref:Chaplin n=1 Tax=Nonomuraea zeae TaxID=1642303 RepID=A0A5S4G9Y6_9ACTN|nr:chaplin family protein [Nonomuraea zeae]TMR29763.1 chaplin [Nonomuraea zeae]